MERIKASVFMLVFSSIILIIVAVVVLLIHNTTSTYNYYLDLKQDVGYILKDIETGHVDTVGFNNLEEYFQNL